MWSSKRERFIASQTGYMPVITNFYLYFAKFHLTPEKYSKKTIIPWKNLQWHEFILTWQFFVFHLNLAVRKFLV